MCFLADFGKWFGLRLSFVIKIEMIFITIISFGCKNLCMTFFFFFFYFLLSNLFQTKKVFSLHMQSLIKDERKWGGWENFYVLTFFPTPPLQRPHKAIQDEMTKFHSDDYIKFLRSIRPDNMSEYNKQMQRCEPFFSLSLFICSLRLFNIIFEKWNMWTFLLCYCCFIRYAL